MQESDEMLRAAAPSRRTVPSVAILIVILIVALGLRVHGFNWDAEQNVHPDERFIGGTLEQRIAWPSNPLDLLSSQNSWNPGWSDADRTHHTHGFNYGSLPLYLIYIFSHLLALLGRIAPWWSSWQDAAAYPKVIDAGRILSALADTVTVYLVFLIGTRLAGKGTGLYAAALAAFAVLSIQLAHFTTVDILLTTFTTGTLLAGIDLFTHARPRDYVITGIWLAAALATKTSALPVVVVPLVAHLWNRLRADELLAWRTVSDALLCATVTVAALFVFQPYMFLDYATYVASAGYQSDLAFGRATQFFTIKWWNTPKLTYPFGQLTLYSLGLPLALAAYAGVIYEALRTLTRKRNAGALVALFVVVYFVSAGILYMKYLRYMEPIVPPLCVLAAILVTGLSRNRTWMVAPALRAVGFAIGALVLALTACYGLAYEHIYVEPHTHLQATCWMAAHIPQGTLVAQDGIDENIPLGTCGRPALNYPQASVTYNGQPATMPTYDLDTPAKVRAMAGIMAEARYYFITSFRAGETFDHAQDLYPYTHRFYQALLDSKLGVQDPIGYTLVKAFVEHPQLGPWTFDDYGANQNFDEYDHPPVFIFRNTGNFGAARIGAIMLAAAPGTFLGSDVANPPKSLLLTPKQLAENAKGATYAQMFPPDSFPMRHPIITWLLMIEALGLLALPISMRLFGRLRDCGFVVAKTVGILLLSYAAWILPSLGIAAYSRTEIALDMIPLATLSLAWGVRPRDAWIILRQRRIAVAVTEAAFLLGFAAFTYIRMLYPDMWHYISGGEKTMDFSFLNAIVRSRAMPPLDPWFGGGYLNYYYYGHFTVATLLKLAGITPTVAINLAIPTFFALALATCVSIGYNIVGKVHWAVAAGVFAMLSGNLYAAQQTIDDLQAAGPLHDQLHPVTSAGLQFPLIGGLIDAVSLLFSLVSGLIWGVVATALGLVRVVTGGASLPQYVFSSGWPWDGSRIIDDHHVITEFPFWTFMMADPHAHLWDIPFALCILTLAFNFAAGGTRRSSEGDRRSEAGLLRPQDSPPLLPGLSLIVWPVMGTVIGAVGPTNLWDLATMLGVILLALLASGMLRGQSRQRTLLGATWRMAALGIFALGLYSPFYGHFQSFYSSIGWTITRHQTPIGDFLTHFGFLIFVTASYLLVSAYNETKAGLWFRTETRALLFTLYYWDRRAVLPRYFHLARAMGDREPATFVTLDPPVRTLIAAAAIIIFVLLCIQYLVLALLSALIALAVLLLIDRRDDREGQDANLAFLHLLLLGGLGVAAACEIVYVRDFYDGDPLAFRNNTVFKLYEEAWLMLGIGSAIGLSRLFALFLRAPERAQRHGAVIESPPGSAGQGGKLRAPRSPAIHGRLWTWLAILALLFVGEEIYPIRLVPIRVAERQTWTAVQNANLGPTLDGAAFFKYAYPADYNAVQWINDQLTGTPIVLQGKGNYRDFSARVTMFTGMPSLVNWGFEDAQQRYSGQQANFLQHWPDEVAPREAAVDLIYNTTDPGVAIGLLHQYHVAYIFVGEQEKGGDPYQRANPDAFHGYAPLGIAKFPRMAAAGQVRTVYDHMGVQIYQVLG